jgi:hypothetical protein
MIMLLAAMVAAVVAPSLGIAQAGDVSTAGKWAGTWEGKLDGLPSVILKVTQGGGAVQGQVSFNLIKKVEGGEPTIAGTVTVPMVNPHVQGNELMFQVIREDRGGDPSKRAVLNFTLMATGERSAKLERAAGSEEALTVDMLRIE